MRPEVWSTAQQKFFKMKETKHFILTNPWLAPKSQHRKEYILIWLNLYFKQEQTQMAKGKERPRKLRLIIQPEWINQGNANFKLQQYIS